MKLFINKLAYAKREILELNQEELPQTFERDIIEFLQSWWDDSLTITASTSGSTGTPKEITLSKERMRVSAQATGAYFGFPKKICSPLSAKFIAGKMMLVRAIEWNAEIHCIQPQSNPLSDVDQEFDFMVMTPHQLFTSLRSEDRNAIDLVKNLLLGGSPIKKELQLLISELHIKVFIGYGMTETMSHVALKMLNGTKPQEYYEGVEGVYFSIDRRECLIIEAKKLLPEPLMTNDIVELIDHKKFRWLGRFDDVINTGGIKVFPSTIELKIESVIAQAFYIAGVPDEKLGEIIVMYIEGKKGDLDENNVLVKVEKLVDRFEKPKRIIFQEKFDYTHNGKLKRKRI